jgi:TRAP-type transport system small permease protein
MMHWLVKIFDAGALISFGAMMGCVLLEVVARNVIHIPTTWAEELSRFMCVWAVFLGSAAAWHRGAHIVVNVLPRRLKHLPKKLVMILIHLLSAVFLLSVWVGSIQIMISQHANTTSALEISISWFYLAVFIGTTGMLAFHIQQMVQTIRTDAVAGFPREA